MGEEKQQSLNVPFLALGGQGYHMTGHDQQQLQRVCSSSLLTLEEFYLFCFLIEKVNPKPSVSKAQISTVFFHWIFNIALHASESQGDTEAVSHSVPHIVSHVQTGSTEDHILGAPRKSHRKNFQGCPTSTYGAHVFQNVYKCGPKYLWTPVSWYSVKRFTLELCYLGAVITDVFYDVDTFKRIGQKSTGVVNIAQVLLTLSEVLSRVDGDD
ncbi:hypothetical protein STEG23_001934 [Scotinomys teguina]